MVAGGSSRAHLDSRARPVPGQVGISGNDHPKPPVSRARYARQCQLMAFVGATWSVTPEPTEAARALAGDLTTTEYALLTAAFRGELLPPAAP